MPVSALIGMGVGKLFAMQDDSVFPSEYGKQWVSGKLHAVLAEDMTDKNSLQASSSTAVALSLLVTQELSVP